MPSPFTSSFASAAAGNTSREGFPNGRNTGSGDWSRARPNGATQTFRRPSVATSHSQQRDSNPSSNNTGTLPGANVYVPPHMNSNHREYQSTYNRNGVSTETRYSKDQLIDLFRTQVKNGPQNADLNDLFVDGWTPGAVNGTSNGGWGKRDDLKDSAGPDICWDPEGTVQPMGILEFSQEEKEAFSTSVNSLLKPPTQNVNKDSTPNNANINRRTSINQTPNAMNNPPSSRSGARRRDSSGDLLGNPLSSPTGNNRFSKEEPTMTSPPPSLLRRMTDFKDNFGPSFEDKDKDSVQAGVESTSPFGTLKRTNTNPLSAGINGSSSPWSGPPPSAGVSPMGAFGSFAIGGASTQIPISGDKPGFGSLRGQSRFKGLMNAGNSENTGSKVKEKASVNSLEKLAESTIEPTQSQWGNDRNMLPRSMNHTLYGDEEDFSTGSAALGGDDASPPLPQSTRYKKPDRQTSYDEIGFSSIGVSSDIPPFRELMQRRDYAQQQTPQHRTLGVEQMNEPMSPTNTNPYQSPEGEKSVPDDIDTDDSDLHSMQYPGAGPFGHGARGFQNQLDAQSNDRSQTSSTGASRGFSSLGGLGSIAALGGSGNWSAAPGAIGTPSRVQPSISAGYSDFAFGSRGDLNSPTHGGLGSPGIFGAGTPSAAGNAGPIGRNSKFNSLLPNVTQEQMRGDTSRQEQPFEENSDSIQNQNAPGFSMRDLEGSSRLGRGVMDEIHGKVENRNRGMQGLSSPFSTNETGQISSSQPAASQALFPGGSSASNYFARAQDQDNVASQMPASQQRQMVMPDRMRWIYRDPQGNTQGPWSGLEMHDWYKAGFFSPELQVKKLEDGDYEPLAQLIRRIGNSREPFLVPQIGIPHGSSSALPSSTTASAGAVPATTPSAAQPPFASSFPSFGTTLSAEQQNALERRKQEEQYLMARQKEHLAQQQVMLKQMQHMQGGVHGQQLHHHSSAHSLQSQPSFGSITSPVGYQPSAGQVPIQPPASGPGFFDGLSRNAGVLGAGADPLSSVREEDFPGLMERLELGRGAQPPFNSSHYTQEGQGHPQHVAAILQERARQHREQEQYDLLQRNNNDDQRTTAERLEQYHQLRAQEEQSQYQQPGPVGGHVHSQSSGFDLPGRQRHDIGHEYDQSIPDPQEQLSLSEQVQKAAAKQAPTTQQQSPWAKMDSGMPQPFPPPQSSSPMPAPTPQRNRQSVADALNVESQSQSPSQADSIETPSAALAPWAKESAEGAKGPSLKEIQAMEARQAAQQEEIAAAARRVAVEQERLNQQNHQTIGPAPGLPSSANWASSISPAVPANTGASAWAKPAAGKPAVATPVSGAKKTLTQIQKEEEARKSRAAAAAAANAASNASSAAALAGGKRYADLAGKASVPTPTSSAAWTTVGAGGKVKTPTVPAPSVNTRTASGGIVQPSAPVVVAKSKAGTSVGTRGPGNPQQANEEFQKWVKSALSKYLNSNMSVDDFVSSLLLLPPEADIISDSIYASTTTLDGHRFAEEFIRRRKMADRGLIPDAANTPGFSSQNHGTENKSGGGWSEVAKRNAGAGGKEESSSAFKVVAGKKKGGKR